MLRAALVLISASLPALAGEFAILSTGLRIHADRHEIVDNRVRLINAAGSIDLPAAAVVGFEEDERIPAPETPAAAPAPPSQPAPVVKPSSPRDLVRAAADHAGLPPAFVESVAKVESGFQPQAVSPKGAIGVMQLMPSTAQSLGADPHDPEQNIEAGARLLRDLLLKYDGDVVKALSAYNAGEGAVDRYHGMPPYSETQQYVNRVVREYLRKP